ncbi:hypothetical protein AWB78_08167 [Caballeronia calidae]|uniref:Chagasin family peptidase inhibitor I42 n=1 Tax=Caballeronia calidae TaxID=1777139 RepID=A0A158EIT7_9BURK|nr:hypothetical protein [Caballeronia calidae]SAL06640.1 hypothetical protein AWB78_08167 [Caballeronia calidae]
MSATQTITENLEVRTASYRGGVVEMRTGERLAVFLNENQNTGFRWALEGETELFEVEVNRYSAVSAYLGGERERHVHEKFHLAYPDGVGCCDRLLVG